ncbi:MAG: DUF1538 domain-containing protein, partial [Acholeplasmatales bacterium]|nr:DUF1538 domain-containing protein [Acholeplasmatales bacterium]
MFIFGIIKGNTPIEGLTYASGETEAWYNILGSNALDCLIAIAPIAAIFFIFNIFFIKLKKQKIISLAIGTVVVYVGLVIFLFGVDFGFLIAGKHVGDSFVNSNNILFGLVKISPDVLKWFLVPIGFVLCFIITLVEPSITVLTKQIDDMTNGMIKAKVLKYILALSIGLAGLLAIVNILTDIDIKFFLIPLYVITLVLTLFSDKLFTGIAYDSGGVTGGAITSAFLIPLCIGIAESAASSLEGGEKANHMLVNGFGIVGYISCTPIIAILLLGIVYRFKLNKQAKSKSDVLDDILGGN